MSTADHLKLAAGALQRAVARALATKGVTAAEWALLRELHAAGAVPPSELADRLGMTRGAVSKLVDRLRAKALVVRARARNGDRRFQTIALTGQGAALIPVLAARAAQAESTLLDRLTIRERAALDRALARLVQGSAVPSTA